VREAEESPLLEVVARERLMNTKQGGKCLAGAVIACISKSCVLAVN
jgi:hypothetical protein